MRFKSIAAKALVITIAITFLTGCSSAKSWVDSFVVWEGYSYVIKEEYVEEIEEEIGEVTKYSDQEGTYTGNFSNTYRVGTKYYAIKGIKPEVAIAVEEEGRYRKAVRNGKYIEE